MDFRSNEGRVRRNDMEERPSMLGEWPGRRAPEHSAVQCIPEARNEYQNGGSPGCGTAAYLFQGQELVVVCGMPRSLGEEFSSSR